MIEHDNAKVMILTHGLYPVHGNIVSGNGIRAWGLAKGLMHNGFDVVYSTHSDTIFPHDPDSKIILEPYSDRSQLHKIIEIHNPVVIIIGHWVCMYLLPKEIKIPVVMDLLAPWLLESEFQEYYDREMESIDYINCFSRADYYLCCNYRQKAFHTAWLLMSGKDCKESNIAIIPISADPNLPNGPDSSLKENPIFLYGGILWPWREPQEWLSQLSDVLVEENKGELHLITGRYPLHSESSNVPLQFPQIPAYQRRIKCFDLLPYEEMVKAFVNADVGIELSSRNSEREISLSFRIIEYLRCGLPVICNDFLEIAELIKSYDAGWVLDITETKALETVIKQIISGQGDLKRKSMNAQRLVMEKFNIYINIKPLVQFCQKPVKDKNKDKNLILSLAQHNNRFIDLQSKLVILERQLEGQEKWCNDLREQVNEKEFWFSDLRNQLDVKDQWCFDLKNQLDNKDKWFSDLRNQLDNKDKWFSDLRNQLDNKDKWFSDLRNQLDVKDQWCFDLKSQLDDKDKWFSDLRNQLDVKDQWCNNLLSELTFKNQCINDLRGSLNYKDQSIASLRESLDNINQSLIDLKLQLTETKQFILEKDIKIIHLNQELTNSINFHNQKHDSIENLNKHLSQQNEQYQKEITLWKSISEERRLISRLKRLMHPIMSLCKIPFKYSRKFYNNNLEENHNLEILFDKLPITPIAELLKTGNAPFEYQELALNRLLLYTDVKDKTVLEVGADDAVVLSKLVDKGIYRALGVNNWRWENKHIKTVKISEQIIMSYGDIRSLPIQEKTFDVILTIASFEHIADLPTALSEMYRLLKPGGIVYSLYGPLWSSGVGHHLWFEHNGESYRFSDTNSTLPLLNNYEHLLFDRASMSEKLKKRWNQNDTDEFIYQIYDSPHINRYMYSDYMQMFHESAFEVVHTESIGGMHIETEIQEQLNAKFGNNNDFTCTTLEVVLRKPLGLKHVSTEYNSKYPNIKPFFNRLYNGASLIYRAIVKRTLLPLIFRSAKNNLAIVTRDDWFPVHHGAAAKIYHTAKVLSYYYNEVYLITSEREKFYVFKNGEIFEELYPRLLRRILAISENSLREQLTKDGFPNNEAFLFFPMLDNNFKLRVLYVALQKSIDIYQAEFPSFIDACSWALQIFGGKSSIVEHNIEFNRISDTYKLSRDIRNYMKNYEVKLCNSVDHVITVSHNDTNGLVDAGVSKEKITMIPHGVDLDNFDINVKDKSYIRSKYGISLDDIVLIFHGIYSYAPNGEAAKLIGSRILPALNAKGYYPQCLAVGKFPPLHTNHPNLIYTDVVEHVAPYIGAADIAVVPLQDGGGTRMKILEYFAGGIPVIATSKGAEGIEVSNCKEILIEDDMDRFIDSIIQLINNADARRTIGLAGRNFVEQLDWRKIGKRYFDLYRR